MASYQILKNQEIVVNLPSDFSIQGWEVSENIAYHSGCNPGYIKYFMDLSAHEKWTFRFEILSLTSGTVNIIVDGVEGTVWSTTGFKEETFEVNGSNTEIQFYATGITSIRVLQVYPEIESTNGTTLAFNEDADKWVTYYSYVPEFMHKFINSFFAFRDGGLWEHNVNEIRNNFFGEQFTSKIVFYCNLNADEVKTFFGMRQKSNKVWSVPNIEVPPRYGKPEGQKSRLKKGNFKHLQGDWYGDFLKDLSDPRFTTELDSLMNGADLQGNIMRIEMENTSTTEVRLTSVQIIVSLSPYNLQ